MMKIEPIRRTTLTTEEVAEYLGLSKDFIYVLCREKKLPHARIGSRYIFKRAAIDKYIDDQIEMSVQNEQ